MMQYTDVKKGVMAVKAETVRRDEESCFEAVFLNGEIPALKSALEQSLGKPIWPSGQSIPLHAEEAIREYGGVTKGQFLYFVSQKDGIIFAMLWPWADNAHTTLKFVYKKA